jgi:hypothetical protein
MLYYGNGWQQCAQMGIQISDWQFNYSGNMSLLNNIYFYIEVTVTYFITTPISGTTFSYCDAAMPP